MLINMVRGIIMHKIFFKIVNFIVLVSGIIFAIDIYYIKNIQLGDNNIIYLIAFISFLCLLLGIIIEIIIFFYKIKKKILFKEREKTSNKNYIIISLLIILSFFIYMFADYNIQSNKSKQVLSYIESYVVSNQQNSENMNGKNDGYIVSYKKSNSFQNDLINFAVQESDMYLNKKATNQSVLKDKLDSLLMTLHINYPNRKEINYAYDKMNDESLEDIDANTNPKAEDTEQNTESTDTESGNDLFKDLETLFPIFLILLPFIIFNFIIARLIYKDCLKRGMNAANWGLATFFFGLIAIIMYVVVRDPRQDI